MSSFTDQVRTNLASRPDGLVERFVADNGLRGDILDAMAEGLTVAAIYRTLKKSYNADFSDTVFKQYCANLREELSA